MEPLATSPVPAAPAGRPLSAGDVIGRSFSVWFGNFVPFSIVTLVLNVPLLLLAAIMPRSEGIAWRLLSNFVSGITGLVVAGALTYGVLQSLRGSPVPVGELFRTGFAKFGRVFIASLSVGVRVFIGLVLLVVPGIVIFCQLYVAVPAAVMEPDGGPGPVERSRALTDGSRWTVFFVSIVTFVVTAFVGGLAGVVLVLGASLPTPVTMVIATAIGALASPLGACAAAVAYNDLRLSKEGVDTTALVKVFE